jgi:hypothetical protein
MYYIETWYKKKYKNWLENYCKINLSRHTFLNIIIMFITVIIK